MLWELKDAQRIRSNLTMQQQRNITTLYKDVYNSIKKKLKNIPVPVTMSEQAKKRYLETLSSQLADAYNDLGQQLGIQIVDTATQTAVAVTKDATAFAAGVGLQITGAYSHVPDDIVTSIATGQVYKGNWSLNGAIWHNVSKHQSDINKIIAAGVAENKSVYDIAKDLEKYVNPAAKKPWDWSRVYPHTNKKIDYNAQRLARTMISHAYQQSLERVCKDNPFVTGYIWQAAHSPRVCPLCKERDGQFFKKEELPLDHPNGMCTFLAAIPDDMNTIANRLADWVDGSRDPAIDRWVSSMEK